MVAIKESRGIFIWAQHQIKGVGYTLHTHNLKNIKIN
jgi:hypothetical protein